MLRRRGALVVLGITALGAGVGTTILIQNRPKAAVERPSEPRKLETVTLTVHGMI
jgi:F0F1-type ATP synthase membrane subunit c/vacuolar-type H+-ATPase subunit K